MLISEDKGLTFRTMLFLSFIAKAMGRKKAEARLTGTGRYLEFNALSAGIKIRF